MWTLSENIICFRQKIKAFWCKGATEIARPTSYITCVGEQLFDNYNENLNVL